MYEKKEERFAVEEIFKSAKSQLGYEVFLAEKQLLAGEFSSIQEMEDHLQEFRESVASLEYEVEGKDLAVDAAQAVVDDLRADLDLTESELADLTSELNRVRDRIEALDPAGLAEKAAAVVRDFPGLDFIGPNLKVSKQVLADLTFELNFTTKTRIDMCTTCHVGIERGEFAEDEQPFTSHPRLDLFLDTKSPHTLKDVGCTICHRGAGESLSFVHTDHRPADAEQAQAWHTDLGWHKQHHWDYPMLKSQHVEASCIQCHTDSMELISEAAPKLAAGYQLFEAKGCYACHKVEWFPTTRRPGPTLVNLAAKLTPEFADAWIAHPRDFRSSTHMPQIFHLENLPTDEVVVSSDHGKGRDILGGEWNDSAVGAIRAFLFANAPLQPLEPIPDGLRDAADAERGREVMNVSGCFACHNTAAHGDDPEGQPAGVPALSNRVSRYNEMGPNLRGVATKLNETWLYRWIKDPTTYWPETRMPNLRLSDRDAMDITAYMLEDPDGIFSDVPDGWETGLSALDHEVLSEQARWFFQKDGRRALEQRLQGEWSDPATLAVAVGEKLISNHGCFSCHAIEGMQSMMPIGTELTTWGSKTIDKLDFGQAYLKDLTLPASFVAENDIQDPELPELGHDYREDWVQRKLTHPRSFDLDKVKTPKDKLRMPWFGFSEEEVEALTTFMLGLVIDEVRLARMVPDPQPAAMEIGMRAVRQNNCTACHVVEPGRVTFRAQDGSLVTVEGEILPLFPGDDLIPPSMQSLQAFQRDRQASEDYMDGEELEELTVRLSVEHADIGIASDKVSFAVDDLVDVSPSLGGDFVQYITEYYMLGTNVANPDHDPNDPDSDEYYRWTVGYDEDQGQNLIEDVDGVTRPYSTEEVDKVRWTFAPPVLLNEGHKLQTDWFYAFLEDPLTLRKQMRVRMPSFFFEEGEAEGIADYFAAKARWDWYVRYAKLLRLSLGRGVRGEYQAADVADAWDVDTQKLNWPIAGVVTRGTGITVEELAQRLAADGVSLGVRVIEAIEAGSIPDILANFLKLEEWGDRQGFRLADQLKQGHQMVRRRTPSYLADHLGAVSLGQAVAADGVNCFQCHPDGDQYVETPIAWAPPLELTRSRLREDWVREWMWSPKFIYPGTAMPDNFTAPEAQYQDQFPDSTADQQIEAILDWIYNMDRPESK